MTVDVIAWDRLPVWAEWVSRDMDGTVCCHELEPFVKGDHWGKHPGNVRRIDEFPGIVVQIGTVGWTESKQRRLRG